MRVGVKGVLTLRCRERRRGGRRCFVRLGGGLDSFCADSGIHALPRAMREKNAPSQSMEMKIQSVSHY